MVFSWANNVLYAGSICLIAFSVIDKSHSLPTALSPILYPLNYTCTDCCDLLTCMGLDNMITGDIFEFLCSKTSIATLPTCYTKHNLNHCSYMKKYVSIIPSTDKIAEYFTKFCQQKEVAQAVTSCLINSSVEPDAIHRCTSPYMNGLTDRYSDICETTTSFMTMSRCIVSLLKIANCSGTIIRNYEQLVKLQIKENPFCTNASAQMCKELYLVIISLVLIWNKIALKI